MRAKQFDGIFEPTIDAKNYDASEEERALVSALQDWYNRTKDYQAPYMEQMALNRRYLRGDYSMVRHRITGEILKLDTQSANKLKSQHNYLRVIYRAFIGKLTRNIPTCVTSPATSDFDELYAARAADIHLAHFAAKEKLDLKYQQACEYIPTDGISFWHLYWDPTKGQDVWACEICDHFTYDERYADLPCPVCVAQREEEIDLQAQAQSTLDMQYLDGMLQAMPPEMPTPEIEQLQEMLPEDRPQAPMEQVGPLPLDTEPQRLVRVKEGDLCVHTHQAQDVFVDAGATCMEETRRVAIRYVMHLSEARQKFPEIAEYIAPNHYAEDRLLHTWQIRDLRDDYVQVFCIYEAPTSEYPEGRTIWTDMEKILREIPYSPYALIGRMPVFECRGDVVLDEFYPEAPFTNAWHRQKELNLNETSIREFIALLSKPKLLLPNGSHISTDEISGDTEQVIFYNALAGNPMPLAMPQLPPQLPHRSDQLKSDMRESLAVTDQEAGIQSSDPNGRYAAIMEAESSQTIGPLLKRINDEWQALHKAALQMMMNMYHKERIATIAGPEGNQTASLREVTNLHPGWDIVVEVTDGMSHNPAIRLNQALELWNAGVLNNAMGMPDIKKFYRLSGLKFADTGFDFDASERAVASQIPHRISNGEQITVQAEDDPQIFAETLLEWLRGPGRHAEPMVTEQVREIWMVYAQKFMALQQGMESPVADGTQLGSGSPSSPPGPGGRGPRQAGSSPSVGRGQMDDAADDAEQKVRMADQTAERQSRISLKREN